MQRFHFFQTKIDLANVEPCKARLLPLADFRKFVLETRGKTLETVKLLAPHFAKPLTKPQRLLYDADELYVAQDVCTNTYYVVMRDLTMVDLDCPRGGEDVDAFRVSSLEKLVRVCQDYPEWRLAVYTSRKGLHVFVLHAIHTVEERAQFQLDLDCDFYYVIHTLLLCGSSIRLNPKKDDDTPMYTLVGYPGTGVTVPYLDALVKFQERLVFDEVGPCRMK